MLHKIVKEKDYKFGQFVKFMLSVINQDQMKVVNEHFYKQWSISDPSALPGMDNNFPRLKSNKFDKLTRSNMNSVKRTTMMQETVEETIDKFE